MIKILKQIVKKQLDKYSYVNGNINRNDRIGCLNKAWGHVFTSDIVGDYVEFGVYKGDSVVYSLQEHNRFYNWLTNQKKSNEPWRVDVANSYKIQTLPKFHILDTFEGMPANSESNSSFAEKTFMSNLDDVKKYVSKSNKLNIDINYYKGLFKDCQDTFKTNMKGRNIAIANIDCDLMFSTIDALNCIKDNISIGTILMFDDYNAFSADNKQGQRAAFQQFKEESDFVFEKYLDYHFVGQAFIIVDKKTT